jgi:hypothetical protein
MATEIEALTAESGMHISPSEPGGPIAEPQIVAGHVPDEPQEAPRNPRDLLMDKIAAKRMEAIQKEVDYGTVQHAESLERGEADPADEVSEDGDPNQPPLPPRQPQQRAATTQQPQGPVVRVIGVDGKEYVIPAHDYEAMRQSAIYGAHAQARERQQQEAQRNAGRAQQLRQHIPNIADLPDAAAEEAWRRLTYGDPKEGAQVLKDFRRSVLQEAAQIGAQMAPLATQQAIAEQARATEMAQSLERLGQEFPAIFEGDRAHLAMPAAEARINQLRQEYAARGWQVSDYQIMRSACTEVAQAFNLPARATANGSGVGVQQSVSKLDRKRAAPQVPQAASRVASGQPDQPWRGDRSAVVEQLRRARGQQSMR